MSNSCGKTSLITTEIAASEYARQFDGHHTRHYSDGLRLFSDMNQFGTAITFSLDDFADLYIKPKVRDDR